MEEVCPQDTVRMMIDTGKAIEDGEAPVVLHYTDTDNTGATEEINSGSLDDSSVDQSLNEDSIVTDETVESHVENIDEAAGEVPVETDMPEILSSENGSSEITFETGSFSVFGVVYTVEFLFRVNGNEYEFLVPGGGAVSFEHLMDALRVPYETDLLAGTDENGTDDESEPVMQEDLIESGLLGMSEAGRVTRLFTDDVAEIEFSRPDCMQIIKVQETMSIGDLKYEAGLRDTVCSVELTPEQNEEIDSQVVYAGDWVLFSLKPFVTEETLTVTMKDGQVFTIDVTDTRLIRQQVNAGGLNYYVTVTYDSTAGIPEGAYLEVEEWQKVPLTDHWMQNSSRL